MQKTKIFCKKTKVSTLGRYGLTGSLSNKYNGIDSFTTFNDGFSFKIKIYYFSDRW